MIFIPKKIYKKFCAAMYHESQWICVMCMNAQWCTKSEISKTRNINIMFKLKSINLKV